MSRFFAAMLLTGACAVLIGLVTGYYAGMVGGVPLSIGLVAIIGLILVAVAIAFQTGVRAGRNEAGHRAAFDGQDLLRQELDRARRFGRSFVLMRFRTPTLRSTSGEDGDQPDVGVLEMMLRSIDRAWTMKGSAYVLLPEATRDGARHLAARLRQTVPATFVMDAVEYAEFPTDGVTTGSLLSNLRPDPADGQVQPMRLLPKERASDERDSEDGHRTG